MTDPSSAGVAACCENDLPYCPYTQPVPRQRQGCPLTFTPISTVADLHGFEPQKVGNEGSVSVLARRISSVARRTDSRGHSRHVWCSTMCSTSMSAVRTNLACMRTAGPVSICAPVCARKTSSKDVNRGLARMMRVPHVRRSSSEGRAAGDGKVEVPQVRTSCDDGAQDGAVVVPLLEPECNGEGRERGQHRKRYAHVQRVSRRTRASRTRRVLNSARAGRSRACTSAPLKAAPRWRGIYAMQEVCPRSCPLPCASRWRRRWCQALQLVGISRVVPYMCLHGTFLPQLAFGRRERLPDDSCGGRDVRQRTTIRGRGSHRSNSTPVDWWEVAIAIIHLSTFGSMSGSCASEMPRGRRWGKSGRGSR
jgi:hypothetical protein